MSGCNHSHSHSHSHGHSEQKHADRWTNAAAVIGGVASFLSDAFWLADMIDTFGGLETDVMGLSRYAIAFGCTIALFSACGAAYCHRVLDTKNQQAADQSTSSESESGADATKPLLRVQNSLTLWQKIALLGDFLSHAGDVAGPMMFVISLAAKDHLSRSAKIGSQVGTLLLGGLGAFAGVRTCKNTMMQAQGGNAAHSCNHH